MFERVGEQARADSSRRRLLLFLVLGALLGAGARFLRGPVEPPWTLSFRGFGPARIGMSVAEAANALGTRLAEDDASDPCHRAWTVGPLSGMVLIVHDGRIVRIDVTKDLYLATGGVHLGSTEREVRRLHPEAEVEGHPYLENGHYFVLTSRISGTA